MYHTLGIDVCIKNLFLLVPAEHSLPSSTSELKLAYRMACNEIGGEAVCPTKPRNRWVFNPDTITELTQHFHTQTSLTDLRARLLYTPIESMHRVYDLMSKAISHLEHFDSKLHALFDLYIHTMFFQRSKRAGGGSVSSQPGVIWCCPRTDWTMQDLVELLIHELTHHLLFIDERVRGHYQSIAAISSPENFAQSSVLNTSRPLDKVLHSMVVANEILHFRARYGEPDDPHVHPPSEKLKESIQNTIDSLNSLPLETLLMPRGIEIIESFSRNKTPPCSAFHQNEQVA